MSIQTGSIPDYIYVTQGIESQGQPIERIQQVRAEVAKSFDVPEELPAALDEVLERASQGGVLNRFKREGRFLIGLFTPGYRSVGNDTRCEALLYAEGEGKLESGAFSEVRMATWASEKSRVHHDGTPRDPAGELVKLALRDIDKDGVRWGVPVVRSTRVYDSRTRESYVFGERQDQEAIARLEVPQQLKGILGVVAKAWNESLEGGEPMMTSIIHALQAQALANLLSKSIPGSTPS